MSTSYQSSIHIYHPLISQASNPSIAPIHLLHPTTLTRSLTTIIPHQPTPLITKFQAQREGVSIPQPHLLLLQRSKLLRFPLLDERIFAGFFTIREGISRSLCIRYTILYDIGFGKAVTVFEATWMRTNPCADPPKRGAPVSPSGMLMMLAVIIRLGLRFEQFLLL